MSTPLVVAATLTPGEEDGSTPKAIPLAVSATYVSKGDFRYAFPSGGTTAVALGTLPSTTAAVLVEVLSDSTSSVTVKLNGDATGVVLSPGGFLLLTKATVSAISLTYAGAAAVRVVALG